MPESVVDTHVDVRTLSDSKPGEPKGKEAAYDGGFVAPHPGMRAHTPTLVPDDQESFFTHPGTPIQHTVCVSCKLPGWEARKAKTHMGASCVCVCLCA